MSTLPTLCIAGAAALFIALSALMNALFLSSLGRSPLEVGLLAAVSLAADGAKAALPVVVVRSVRMRAWCHATAAVLMLIVVITLSLASGAGFAAMTRDTATAARQADADSRSALLRQLRDIETHLDRMPVRSSAAVLDAEIARATIDRRWTVSKSCSEIAGTSVRQFCSEVLRLKSERAAAFDRERLASDRVALVDRMAALTPHAPEADPQAAALADLTGVDTSSLRRYLTLALAVTLEVGAVILILLLTGPALLRWSDPDRKPEPIPAILPHSKDVAHWHRRREASTIDFNRSGTNER